MIRRVANNQNEAQGNKAFLLVEARLRKSPATVSDIERATGLTRNQIERAMKKMRLKKQRAKDRHGLVYLWSFLTGDELMAQAIADEEAGLCD